MTEGIAIEVACSKMRELETTDYLIRYRHFQILPGKSLEMKHSRQYMILLTPDARVRVLSMTGVFDMTDQSVNEQQYVFTGRMQIENMDSTEVVQVKFLQVIPQLKS